MSKNLLFGFKKWYVYTTEDKKTHKIRLTRQYNPTLNRLTLKTENPEINIENSSFIENLKNYKQKRMNIEDLNKKFNKGNILFKLKLASIESLMPADRIINIVEILQQSEKLAKNRQISRKQLEKYLSENVQLLSNSSFEYNKILITLCNDEEFNKKMGKEAIKYRILTEDELSLKKKIYEICMKVNLKLYEVLEEVAKNSQTNFSFRYYEESFLEELNESIRKKNIILSLEKANELCQSNLKMLEYLQFLYGKNGNKKISNNKEQFFKKLDNLIKYQEKLTNLDIAEFLLEELKNYNKIGRNEQINSTVAEASRIKTYITFDQHIKYSELKEEKNNILVNLIKKIQNNELENKIIDIYEKFEINELAKQIKEECNKRIDTNLFGIFKLHYKNTIEKDKNIFDRMEKWEKELYKIIYRYLKGRIEKIISRKEFIDFGVENLSYKKTKNKVIKRVKQYMLENILYIGKLKHCELQPQKNNFIEFHAKEELCLELLAMFSYTNLSLEEITTSKKDFFGDKLSLEKIEINNKKIAIKRKIFSKLGFIDEKKLIFSQKFKQYVDSAYSLRSSIFHGKYLEIEKELKSCNTLYEETIKAIMDLKASDEEISKNLNLNIVFKNKNEIFTKVNTLEYQNQEVTKYFPSYSKLVPSIKNILFEKNKNILFFDENIKDIIVNAVIYVNKILYYKVISNKSFLDKIEEDLTIKEKYILAQKKSSKGDKKAIKKFQRYLIEEYLSHLSTNYLDLFDFSKFNMNIDEIKEKIKNNKTISKEFIIKRLNKNLEIKNDFEYVIIVSCLLVDNTFINKIKNRLFSTDVWLNQNKFDNLIKILDMIMEINIDYINIQSKNILQLEDLEKEKMVIQNMEIINYIERYENLFSNVEHFLDIKNEILKNYNEEDFKDGKYTNFFNKIESKSKIPYLKDGLKEIKNYWNNYKEEIENKINNIYLTFPKEIIENYRNLIQKNYSDKKFNNIYYQNDLTHIIYRKKCLNICTKPYFNTLYEKFLSKKINELNTNILFREDIFEKINKTNKFIKEINDLVHNLSKKDREKIIKLIKMNPKFYKDNIGEKTEYLSYDDFFIDYEEIMKYKKNKGIIEFNILTIFSNYLAEINWKLAIQLSRFERDIHYIISGLYKLDIINFDKVYEDRSLPYAKIKNNDYIIDDSKKEDYKNKIIPILNFFEIDLNENSNLLKKEKESIRNYVAHFYLLREAFVSKNICEVIEEVSEILKYRSKYNNSTHKSIFEVFKKEIDINYLLLETKFSMRDEEKLNRILTSKKTSVLELEDSYSLKNEIIEFLKYKVTFSD